MHYYEEETPFDIGDSCMVCEAESCVYRTEGVYTPRNAEDSPLYQVVADNLKTFLYCEARAALSSAWKLANGIAP